MLWPILLVRNIPAGQNVCYSSWLMNWRFCVTRKNPELLNDIRDLATLFYMIFESNLGICDLQ